MIIPKTDIKKKFYSHFNLLIKNEEKMMVLFYEILILGSAYIVGGYFRDFLNNRKSRDIDVIVDIDSKKILDLLKQLNCIFLVNRHGGIKVQFETINLDIWSIEDNWAFKNKLVKMNEDDKLNSIAKGCFYNYDSLVINLHNFTYNLRYYNEFMNSNQLDILQSQSSYKNLNPTTEANILRAFFIKQTFKSKYSANTYDYLLKKIGALKDNKNFDVLERLLDVRSKYPKYKSLTTKTIHTFLLDLEEKDNPNDQLYFNL